MMGTYQFCARAILLEAAALIVAGFVAGMVFDRWQAILGAQAAVLVSEVAGYAIESWLHRRRGR
jgi:hypothetical protein